MISARRCYKLKMKTSCLESTDHIGCKMESAMFAFGKLVMFRRHKNANQINYGYIDEESIQKQSADHRK